MRYRSASLRYISVHIMYAVLHDVIFQVVKIFNEVFEYGSDTDHTHLQPTASALGQFFHISQSSVQVCDLRTVDKIEFYVCLHVQSYQFIMQ